MEDICLKKQNKKKQGHFEHCSLKSQCKSSGAHQCQNESSIICQKTNWIGVEFSDQQIRVQTNGA